MQINRLSLNSQPSNVKLCVQYCLPSNVNQQCWEVKLGHTIELQNWETCGEIGHVFDSRREPQSVFLCPHDS